MNDNDTTLCIPKKCKLKFNCHRYFINQTVSRAQSYFMEEPYNEEKNTCKYLWRIRDGWENNKYK